MNGTQRFIPPQRQASDDANEERDEDPTPPNPPVFTFPGAPGANGQPAFQPNPPQQMIVNPATGAMQPMPGIPPAQPAGYPPSMPFGTSTPGMISPQPGQPTRPPGGRQQR
jgi:hypothetical protein